MRLGWGARQARLSRRWQCWRRGSHASLASGVRRRRPCRSAALAAPVSATAQRDKEAPAPATRATRRMIGPMPAGRWQPVSTDAGDALGDVGPDDARILGLVSIDVTPPSQDVVLLATGNTLTASATFTATGHFSDGHTEDVTSRVSLAERVRLAAGQRRAPPPWWRRAATPIRAPAEPWSGRRRWWPR